MAHTTRRALLLLALAAGMLLAPRTATAHWCDDLWASSYNIVVRPASDTLDVPGSGSATLKVWVRNNMGYPLVNFVLAAEASGFNIDVAAAASKVTGYLLPGENLEHVLTVSGGGGQLSVEGVTFYVAFGDPGQDDPYGPGGSAVMIKKADGSIYPGSNADHLGDAGSQAKHLGSSAEANYGDLASAISQLLGEYCAGRGSWDSGNGAPISTYCSSETSTQCPGFVDRWPSKYDWQHLWAAGELAHRVSVLTGAQLTTLRERLVCAWEDDNFAFQAFAVLALGYLGDDNGPARAFLEDIAANGAAAEQDVAKAGLLLFGDDDLSSDVEACTSSGNDYAEVICGAALGIAFADDDAVNEELVPRALWIYPDDDNGLGLYTAHVLDLVVWDRRGWTTNADDTGAVSFYGELEPTDETPPAAPTGMTCNVLGSDANPVLRLSWDAVSTDVNGAAESVAGYDVYWGKEARSGSCTQPNTGCDAYAHSQATTAVWLEPGALDPGDTYYFAVSADDTQFNVGAFSTEATCVAPTPANPPTAVIHCDVTSGEPTLTVNCDCDGSSDPDGDLASCHFSLDNGAEETGSTVTYVFDQPGGHNVTLRVVDASGLEDTDAETITVSSPGAEPPVAQPSADPTTGEAPLEVHFSAAGSHDPDGAITAYQWDFDDGSPAATDESPTHEFAAVGVYQVTLTVTDDGDPPLQGVGVVTITVGDTPANSPPDLSYASATPAVAEPNQAVHFDASGVIDPDGDGFTLGWDFGDGESSADAIVDHPYTANGTYQALLTAQDDGEPAIGPATRTFEITVTDEQNNPPAVDATVTPDTGVVPLTVVLDASGSTDPDGHNLTFEWVIADDDILDGDDETLTGAKVEHAFTEPGHYTISLAVTDDGAPPLRVNRSLEITVYGEGNPAPGGGGGGTVSGSCAGGGAPTTMPLLLLLALALLVTRVRQR